MLKNPVLTSKAAVGDYQNILARHDEILNGLRQQSERVQMYNDQQVQARDQEKAANIEQEKIRMTNEQKQQELDIKRLALTS